MNRFHSLLYKYATSETMANLSNRYPVKAEDIKTVRDLYNAVWVMFRGNMAELFSFVVIGLVVILIGSSFLWVTYRVVIYPFMNTYDVADHIIAWMYYIMLAWYLVYRFEIAERWYNNTIGFVIKSCKTAIGHMFGQKVCQKITDKLNQELDIDTKDPE